jgi:hypothetical protein
VSLISGGLPLQLRQKKKVNLQWRGIISIDTSLRVNGYSVEESLFHLFFDYIVLHNVWMKILKWLGIYLILSNLASTSI